MKQMWIQDNYVISIWNGEFYSLDNLKTIHIHTNGPQCFKDENEILSLNINGIIEEGW